MLLNSSRCCTVLHAVYTCGEVDTLASLLQETLQAAKKNEYKLAKPDQDALIAASSGASPPVQLACAAGTDTRKYIIKVS